jgi:hypothetical protein
MHDAGTVGRVECICNLDPVLQRTAVGNPDVPIFKQAQTAYARLQASR